MKKFLCPIAICATMTQYVPAEFQNRAEVQEHGIGDRPGKTSAMKDAKCCRVKQVNSDVETKKQGLLLLHVLFLT